MLATRNGSEVVAVMHSFLQVRPGDHGLAERSPVDTTHGSYTGRMADARENLNQFRTTRRLRLVGRVALGLWMSGWLAFAVVVGTGGRTDLLSALAVVICALFGLSVLCESRARRLEIRALVALTARDDLSAARSRGLPRVR
jgi:hypothetical protein